MSGSDKCEACEIEIRIVRAEGRGYTEITQLVPEVKGRAFSIIHYYYCDTCWVQQQARMFG
jgi:hypothetical protein